MKRVMQEKKTMTREVRELIRTMCVYLYTLYTLTLMSVVLSGAHRSVNDTYSYTDHEEGKNNVYISHIADHILPLSLACGQGQVRRLHE